MKKLMLSLMVVAISINSFAENWKLDQAHTRLGFNARYLVITDVEGQFKKFNGNFTSTKSDWSDMKAEFTVDVNSIYTDNEMRDKHLMGDDFFHAEKYPTITFTSKSIKKISNNKYVLTGDLKIRDVVKTVQLPLVYGGTVKDPWGNTKAGFKSTGKINRQEYGLSYKDASAAGEAVVSDEIEFTIDAVLIKQ